MLKSCAWPALAINGARSFLGALVIGAYFLIAHRRFVFKKATVLGALAYIAMTSLFVMSNQWATAGNAIVLQFSCPIWILAFNMLFFHKAPSKKEVCAPIGSNHIVFISSSSFLKAVFSADRFAYHINR